MKKRNKTDVVQVPVRMREVLRAVLERAAKDQGCSMNAEIVRRLERSFERQDLLSEILALALGENGAAVVKAFAANEDKLRYRVMELVWDIQRNGGLASLPFLPPPTAEEFEDMKRRHEWVAKSDSKR